MYSDAYAPRPFWLRLFLAVPVLGWVAKDLLFGDKSNIYYFVATLVSLWGMSILAFGVVGLYIPALCMVPLMFIYLILITRG